MTELEATSDDAQEFRPRRGCLFWGCATLGLIVVVVGGSILLGLYLVHSDLKEFSSSAPMDVPVRETSDEEYDLVENKMHRIQMLADLTHADSSDGGDGKAAVDERESREAAVITADDLNALIGRHPKARSERLPGRLRVRGAGDRILVDLSWPMEELIGISGLSGRYFNGTVRARLSFDYGKLGIDLEEGISPDGKKLSDRILRPGSRVLTEKANEWLGDVLHELESVEVKGGEIHVLPRAADGSAEG